MVNKKGFMRVVEATIAVILVLSSLVFLSAQREVRVDRDLSEIISPMLDEVARNLSFRENVAKRVDEEVLESEVEISFKGKLKNPTLNVSVEICNASEVCFLEPYPENVGEIYSSERIVSGSIVNETADLRKVKVFMWRNRI